MSMTQTVICRACGQSNSPGAAMCTGCWGLLDRVAAGIGEEVASTAERDLRKKEISRIRRSILGSVLAAVGVVLAIQFLNVTLPVPPPSSDISSVSGPGEWAMIYRTSEGAGPVPEESASIEGQVKWTFETSKPIVSTPTIKGGRLYLTTQDNRVMALAAATGSIIWEYGTETAIDSSPTVAEGLVIFATRDRKVIALDADTGQSRWQFVTGEGGPNTGSSLVKDGVVYVGSGDGKIYALDALTGTERWSHLTRDWITNTAALSGDILVVSSMDGRVTMYDTNTGKRRFSFRGLNQDVVGSPIIVEDSIYVPYRNGILATVNLKEEEVLFYSRWYRFKLQMWLWGWRDHPGLPKGVERTYRLRGTIEMTPAADEGKVYVPIQDGRLHAIDRSTGKRLWLFDSRAYGLSTPTIVEDTVLVGDGKGMLYAVDKDSGEKQWELQIAERGFSTPVLAGGTLYLASKDGTLYAVE
ncbi:MAG: PQQ-binding-like beta-propeller repeat protein [Dehalococcoidia bacterium]|nr:PQQ-binding-like beta-propeller repeat protein [Dehalococcoidia bacterium]